MSPLVESRRAGTAPAVGGARNGCVGFEGPRGPGGALTMALASGALPYFQ